MVIYAENGKIQGSFQSNLNFFRNILLFPENAEPLFHILLAGGGAT